MTRFALIIFMAWAAMAPAAGGNAEVADLLAATGDKLTATYQILTTGYYEEFMFNMETSYVTLDVLDQISRSDHAADVAAVCREALASDDANLRLTAATYLCRIEGPDAIADFIKAAYEESTPEGVLLLNMVMWENDYGDDEGAKAFRDEFVAKVAADVKSNDAATRLKAVKFAAFMPNEDELPIIKEALASPDAAVRKLAVSSLSRYFGDENAESYVRDSLLAAVKDPDAGIRETAVATLARVSDDDAVEAPLLETLKDPNVDVRRAAAQTLNSVLARGGSDRDAAEKALKKALKNEKDGVTRCLMAAAYGYVAGKETSEGAYDYHYLTPNGYWAFLTGDWDEKKMDEYYDKVTGSAGGGG